MKTLSIICLSFLVLASCSDVKKSSQLSSIDEMSKKLESVKAETSENKVDSAHHISIEARETELRIKNNYFMDTIDLEFGTKMDQHKNMRRAMAKIDKMYADVLAGCDEITESLRQLRYDVENGDGERPKYEEYIAYEKEKMDQVVVLSDEYLKTKKFAVDTYRSFAKEIDDFSWKLWKENKKK